MDHFNAVVEILAEVAARDLGIQVFVGGCQQPHVHRNQGPAADTLQGALLQYPQYLGLRGEAQVADLVQEQGAPIGLLEMPDTRGYARRHALLDAKQLAFHQGVRQGRAVQCDEPLARPGTGVVDGLGDHFLARAAFTGDEHIDQAVANPFDEARHLPETGAGTDDAVRGIAVLHFAEQVGILFHQFVLAAPQLADQLRRFDGDGRMGGEGFQRLLVARGKIPVVLVEGFKGSDDLAALVAHGHGEHVTGMIPGLPVDGMVEAGIVVSVANIGRASAHDGAAHHPAASVETEYLRAAQGNLRPQLVAFAIEQKNAGTIAIQEAGGFSGNDIEQAAEIAFGVHLLADGQNYSESVLDAR